MSHIDPPATDVAGGAGIDIGSVVAGFADLGTLAPVAIEVIRMADDDTATIRDITAVIRRDPGLASRLLRVANSAMYSQITEVTTLERATTLLGLRMVKLLSLGFNLIAEMRSGPIDTSIVWRRSLATSVLAHQIAEYGVVELADEALAAGLLSHIGKLALANDSTYLRLTGPDRLWLASWEEAEILGFTSDEVTARILHSWNLPPILVDAIRHRSSPPGAELEPVARLACCLQVADGAATLMLADTDDRRAEALDTITLSAATHLGMTIKQIESVMSSTSPTIDDIARLLDLDAIAATPVLDIISSAREHLTRLSLDIASTLSHEERRNTELSKRNERLAAEVATDSLTGIPNRRTFDAYLANHAAGQLKSSGRGLALGLLLLDLDYFKSINDRFGHPVGDEVIRAVATRIHRGSRKGELCARVGGEEFAIVLKETSADELLLAAERFRALIGDQPVDTSCGQLRVTASVGAAGVGSPRDGEIDDHDVPGTIYRLADAALYEAKASGRDCTTVHVS